LIFVRVRSLIYQKIEVKRAIDAMLAPKTGRFLRTTHRFLATRINGYALKMCSYKWNVTYCAKQISKIYLFYISKQKKALMKVQNFYTKKMYFLRHVSFFSVSETAIVDMELEISSRNLSDYISMLTNFITSFSLSIKKY